jgi:AcrR family transcriptional regulator
MRMTVTSPTTRESLLAAAVELLRSVGYASFSYRDLADAVGIRTASIHYHFPSKSDLGVALVEELRLATRERERAAGSRPSECARPPDRALQPHRRAHLRWTEVLPDQSPAGRIRRASRARPARVNRLVDEKMSIITRWLDEGRNLGHLRFPRQPPKPRPAWSGR